MNDIILVPSGGQTIVKVFENVTNVAAGQFGFANQVARQFNAFADYKQLIGGGSIAVGNTIANTATNGKAQIVIGTGPGIEPLVRVFDVEANQPTASMVREIKSVRSDAVGGVNVAVGDLNGNGVGEIIVSAKNGGRSWVDIYLLYSETGVQHVAGFQAFGAAEGNNVAVNVLVRDTDGDGVAEILTVQGAKGKAGASIRKFQLNGTTLQPSVVADIFADWSDELFSGLFIG